MKKSTLLFMGMFACGAMSVYAQITKPSVWAPTSNNVDTFIYGGNYKNTAQAGVTITVLDKGSADKTKPSPVIGDYKFPHWDLLWHFNNLKDNKNNLIASDDVATTYLKVADIAYTDTLFWLANATDPVIPLAKTIAASHLPTRNGIFFAGVDALEGKHAMGVISGKDWGRLQSYQGGGNAILVESVSDFLSLLNWGKVIKERTRSGSDPNYTYSATIHSNSFSVPDTCSAFGLKIGENNNALAFYPGMYNKTDLRLAFQFDSSRVSSDITFKLLQVSKGTSGKNMKYKMVVSLMPPTGTNGFVNIGAKIFLTSSTGCDKTDSTSYGETGPERYVIDNVFEAQGGANDMTAVTTISLVDKIKTKNPAFTIDDLSKKRIIVAIIGEATEAAAQGTYHPIIAIDDIHVSYWIDWYKANNGGLYTGIEKTTVPSAKIIGLTGQIQITGAKAAGAVYNLIGRKVASFEPGNKVVTLPSGIYLVKEQNQPTVKVYVK
jgi:hypothetical protein